MVFKPLLIATYQPHKYKKMNDFIKIKYVDKKYQLPNAKMDFNISVNNETGETDGKLTGSYYDMKVIKYPSQRTMVQGSIHKFFNRTNFNGNDFTFENQCNTIINLQDELGINPDYCKSRERFAEVF